MCMYVTEARAAKVVLRQPGLVEFSSLMMDKGWYGILFSHISSWGGSHKFAQVHCLDSPEG